VKIFELPGLDECVGVSDGTDAWIAPVVADPFSVNIKRVLEQFRNGTHVLNSPEDAHPPRKRKTFAVTADPVTPAPRQRRLFSV